MSKKSFIFAIFSIFFITTSLFGQNWQEVKDPYEIFEKGYIQVVGVSESGQSRYAAIRSATVVAQRNLLEIIKGIHLYGETTVKDGMLKDDLIKTRVEGFLKGAYKCGERYYATEGYAEVCLRVRLSGRNGLYSILLPIMKERGMLPPKRKIYVLKEKEAPKKVEKVYDGLIVDVRNFSFKPALVNRILAENGDILFDPSKVVANILVERGCGGFTNEINKAKALLSSWGSKSPLIVPAKEVLKATDVKVSNDSAKEIFESNMKKNFLEEAKVVFVLK